MYLGAGRQVLTITDIFRGARIEGAHVCPSCDRYVWLPQGGVIVIGAETAQKYVSRFESVAQANQQTIVPVEMGSLEQLHTLIDLIVTKKVTSHGEMIYVTLVEFPEC